MEDNKKNTGLVVLVIVLIICIFGLLGYIVFDRVLSNKIGNDNDVTTTKTTSTTKVINANDITQKSLEECNYESCEIYKSSDVSIMLKNINRNDDFINADVYINEVFSHAIKFHNVEYNFQSYIDINLLQNNYFIMRFANEAAMYDIFYLFNNEGKFITDFEEERKQHNSDWFNILVENDELILNYNLYYFGEEPIKFEYCESNSKPTDNYMIIKKANINNNKLNIYETKNITWEEAYKCSSEDQDTQFCGNIYEVVCE